MALKKTVSTVHGIVVQDAYIRVEGLSLQGKDKINFFTRSYADKDKQSFEQNAVSCSYNMQGNNPIAQAYAHLKTLEAFSDAVDC